MARPLVLVYQDLAQPQAVPITPDLNSVIVGPAYVIKDYPDDAAEILLSQAYGLLEAPAAGADQYSPPASTADAVTVTSYPGNAAGALVDRESIRVFLQLPRVILAASYAITGVASLGTGATVFSTTGNENKVTFVGIADITVRGLRAGDRIILTSSHATPQTFVSTVASVGEPNTAGDLTDTTSLRMAANIPPNGTDPDQFLIGAGGSVEVRIERTLATQEFVDADGVILTFPDASSDKLVLKGGVTLPVDVEGTETDLMVSYARVYLAYRSLRQDLTDVDSVTGSDIRTDSKGRAFISLGNVACFLDDARNPLGVGLSLALQNAGASRIYYVGVQQNTASGHQAARASVDTRRDLYAFVPLTDDVNIIGGYKTEWVTLADPVLADQTGTPQKFRIVIGSIPLPTARVVSPESITGVAQQPSSSATGLRRTLTLASSVSFDLTGVIPGDLFTIGLVPASGTWSTRRGTHVVSHVNTTSELEVTPGNSRWNDAGADAAAPVEMLVRSPQGNVKLSRLASLTFYASATQGVHFAMNNPTTVGGPYRVQYTNVGGSVVTIAISGFDITIGINPTVTTTQEVVDAVNDHEVLSTILTASLVSTSVAIPAIQAPTSINVYAVTESFADGGATIVLRLRNPGSTASPTFQMDNSGGAATGAVVSVVGDDILVTYENGVATLSAVVAAVNAHAAARLLVSATLVGVDGAASLNHGAPVAINDLDDTYSNVAVSSNDDLFLWLFDANASFLTDAVAVGDVLEFPVDPNDYTPGAFDGRLLSFTVAQVISEFRVAVQNLGDDSSSAVNELPHYYLRDFASRLLDNETATTSSAMRYRIRRALTKDDQATALITVAQSVKSKRATICWPDSVTVAGLKDGSLPRASSGVRTAAGPVPGWAIACQVAGALAGLPVQQGLTNLGLVGVEKLFHSSGYFREAQLTAISNGGLFVMHQRVPGELPFCIHQLTTDPAALETGELSVVKNFDYISIYFQQIIEGFLGQYNVLPETLSEIQRAVIDGTERLKSRRVARIGPPLLSGEIQQIKVSDFAADRIVLYFKGTIPRPLNGVDFHIVI